MKIRNILAATILFPLLYSTPVIAETTGQNGVDETKIRVKYGFSQFKTSMGLIPQNNQLLTIFGGRVGTYIGTSESFYIGGGGNGGFSVSPGLSGGGYGYFQIGNRHPIIEENGSFGVDYYTGFGGGAYGSAQDFGPIVGPVFGGTVFMGANDDFEFIGLFAEAIVNVINPNASMIHFGLSIGSKTSDLSVLWKDRRDLDPN
jgi:hypothetical protein